MPLYTYKCKNCGKVVEKFHKMSVNGAEKCEDCGSETLRVFLPTGIIFKGSGFYSTDYKSGTSKANLNSGSQDGEKKEETREIKENREDSRGKDREEKKEEHKTEQSASKSSEPKAQDKDKNTDKSKDKDKN
jgi:putative FmdB family regulatory protein